MARVIDTNPHVNTAAKRTAAIKKFTEQSFAIEGIKKPNRLTSEASRDAKTGRFVKKSA
jgi:hypothetical protein